MLFIKDKNVIIIPMVFVMGFDFLTMLLGHCAVSLGT